MHSVNTVTISTIRHPTPVLLPGKPHGQRSLVGCSPWGLGESATTEWLSSSSSSRPSSALFILHCSPCLHSRGTQCHACWRSAQGFVLWASAEILPPLRRLQHLPEWELTIPSSMLCSCSLIQPTSHFLLCLILFWLYPKHQFLEMRDICFLPPFLYSQVAQW